MEPAAGLEPATSPLGPERSVPDELRGHYANKYLSHAALSPINSRCFA